MTNETPISWTLALSRIPAAGLLDQRRAADTQERAALAHALGIVAVERFELAYDLRPLPGGRVLLQGTLIAHLTQACVVSLDPVDAVLDEPVDVEFWPPDQIVRDPGRDQSVLDDEDPEPLAGHFVEIGRIAYETAAAALDPYPRRLDAALEQTTAPLALPASDKPAATAHGTALPTANPFAALAKWRPKPP